MEESTLKGDQPIVSENICLIITKIGRSRFFSLFASLHSLSYLEIILSIHPSVCLSIFLVTTTSPLLMNWYLDEILQTVQSLYEVLFKQLGLIEKFNIFKLFRIVVMFHSYDKMMV